MERYYQRPLDSHPGTFDWIFDQRPQLHDCDFSGSWSAERCPSQEVCRQVEADLRSHASKLRKWLESSNDIFWVQGKAGSGKSTFIKFLFEHEQTQVYLRRWAGAKVVVAAFFFWAAGSSELEKSYLGLLRAVLFQVLQECPMLIEKVVPRRWAEVERIPAYSRPWTVKELMAAFDILLKAPETHLRFCFFIDGLDEYEGDHRDLVDAIRLLGLSPNIKICVSSRPWNLFQKEYGSNDDLHVALHTLTKRDIDMYIASRLVAATPEAYDTRELRELRHAVRKRSQGVFLWVSLALKDLRRGIDGRDSMRMLQKRLETYPPELREFIQLIFDRIDPAYTKFAGRLLLMMLEPTGPPALISLGLLEDSFSVGGNFESDTRWSPRSESDMYSMVDRAAVCANNWCRDILQPIDSRKVRETIASLPYKFRRSQLHTLDFYRQDVTFEHFISYLSFGHRTIHQFVEEKASDGTLSKMAGSSFEPRLGWLYAFVELSKCVPNLPTFVQIFSHALWLVVAPIDPDRQLVVLSEKDQNLANGIQKCCEAFDLVGQEIERPAEWIHWTVGQLAGCEYHNKLLLGREPIGGEHISFASYLMCLGLPSHIVSSVSNRQREPLTELQKQFLVEVSLIPDFYDDCHLHDEHWPCTYVHFRYHYQIIVQVIRSGIDVNRPTRRSGCCQDYSVWQFYLLWLHDYFDGIFGDEGAERCGECCCITRDHAECLVGIFRTFLQQKADPFAVISSMDLIQCHRRELSANEAAILSVADVVGDLQKLASSDITCSSDHMHTPVTPPVTVVGEIETLLNEAFAHAYIV